MAADEQQGVIGSSRSTSTASDEHNAIATAIVTLAPYLLGMFVSLCIIHVQYQPRSSLRSLMKRYRKHGIAVEGQVLSCEPRMTATSRSTAKSTATDTGTCNSTGDTISTTATTYLTEIMYQRAEHKHQTNPSRRFRDPQQVQSKNFVVRHALKRSVGRGDTIPLLVLPGNARSACPKEVVDDILSSHYDQKTSLDLLVFGLLAVLLLFIGAARAVLRLRLNEPMTGWNVMLLGMLIVEGLPWLYCTDQFLKMKRIRFDNGQPMKLS
eukprot:CAMPEP_0178516712 /NCGR_PEP_ID=MMETSP0696-20121128/25273_1 /TAXON_ID=265572 /ORGANISM="Extubocellulus spinifer, Strain CCMP396" /LENGTH=266 /DNA_ID=CAMNT_0020147033 /DNA_START=46 /DNA_END=842 /DNA_ORIENTATION=-